MPAPAEHRADQMPRPAPADVPERLHLLDALRGWTLLHMLIYHTLWDLAFIFGHNIPFMHGTAGYTYQQSICWSFILLCGFCFGLGRHPLKRGLIVSGCGLLIMLVTGLFMPEERILFGVLTLHGSAMLLLIPLSVLMKKCPAWLCLGTSALLFFLTRNAAQGVWGFEGLQFGHIPGFLYRNLLTAYIGFAPADFWSSDYFPLIPWFFLCACGYSLYLWAAPHLAQMKWLRVRIPVLDWLGRHCLLLYMLHQPVVYGILYGLHWLAGAA